MKKSQLLLTFLMLLVFQQARSEFHTMNGGGLVNKHFLVSIPYYYSQDSAALIDVVINGKHYKFLLDTGAPLSISKRLQKELKFPLLLHTTVNDANGDTSGVDIVKTTSVEIGPLKFHDVPALILDLDAPVFDCIRFDGIIGSNMLRLLALQFNKPEQKIYFADNVDSFHLPAETTYTPMLLNSSQSDPHIVVRLDYTTTDTVLYDSGDQTLFTISRRVYDRMNKNGKLNGKLIAEGKGVNVQGLAAANTDNLPSFLMRTNVSIGRVKIRDVYTEPNYSDQSRIGRELWSHGLVTMDYRHKRFYFSPYRNEIFYKPKRTFGFKYGERNNKFVVTLTWDKTEASACGLAPGDEILALGHFEPQAVPKCDWKAHAEKEITGETMTVKYRNEQGTVKTCILKKMPF